MSTAKERVAQAIDSRSQSKDVRTRDINNILLGLIFVLADEIDKLRKELGRTEE